MKELSRLLSLAVCMLCALSLCNSCGLGIPEDPEFPSYVSYTVSGDVLTLTSGPEQLLEDVKAWLKDNAIYIEVQANYSTGEASEFATHDAAALKKYQEQYIPKFNAYLADLRTKLASGAYGDVDVVKITFCTYAKREQGKDNTLAYAQHDFVYPVAGEQ